jgi:hypothetical protein
MVETQWLLDTLKVSPHDFNVIIEQWPQEKEKVDEVAAIEHAWVTEGVNYLRQFIPN